MDASQNTLLKDYTDTEKGAYLAAIATVAAADRSVSEEEIEFLNLLSEAAAFITGSTIRVDGRKCSR